MKTTLVTIAGGAVYEKYAEQLMASAEQFFRPTDQVEFLVLTGEEGWPRGTMMRYHRLLEGFPDAAMVYLCDADMLFVSDVGDEIIPDDFGIVATLHPGYVIAPRASLPYDANPESAAYVHPKDGSVYYCGGFVGGTYGAMVDVAQRIAAIIDWDLGHGHTPVWHDESALNRILAVDKPQLVLSPSYCYPDDDNHYLTFWPEKYERKLVALDKTSDERGER